MEGKVKFSFTPKPGTKGQIAIVKGDMVKITQKTETGWWRGKNKEGQDGFFPKAYIEVLSDVDPAPQTAEKKEPVKEKSLPAKKEEPKPSPAVEKPVAKAVKAKPKAEKIKCRVSHGFTGNGKNQISVAAGEIVTVIQKTETGWWRGINSKGENGFFPAAYVKELPAEAVVAKEAPATVEKKRTSAIAAALEKKLAPAKVAKTEAPAKVEKKKTSAIAAALEKKLSPVKVAPVQKTEAPDKVAKTEAPAKVEKKKTSAIAAALEKKLSPVKVAPVQKTEAPANVDPVKTKTVEKAPEKDDSKKVSFGAPSASSQPTSSRRHSEIQKKRVQKQSLMRTFQSTRAFSTKKDRTKDLLKLAEPEGSTVIQEEQQKNLDALCDTVLKRKAEDVFTGSTMDKMLYVTLLCSRAVALENCTMPGCSNVICRSLDYADLCYTHLKELYNTEERTVIE